MLTKSSQKLHIECFSNLNDTKVLSIMFDKEKQVGEVPAQNVGVGGF